MRIQVSMDLHHIIYYKLFIVSKSFERMVLYEEAKVELCTIEKGEKEESIGKAEKDGKEVFSQLHICKVASCNTF